MVSSSSVRAASMEPRSFDRGDLGRALELQFSSAASMEPRSFDRGDARSPAGVITTFSLQWSRGLLTAETGGWSGSMRLLYCALQWSRGLLTAETFSRRAAGLHHPRGFNGAAVF